jgi:hypothetical protein
MLKLGSSVWSLDSSHNTARSIFFFKAIHEEDATRKSIEPEGLYKDKFYNTHCNVIIKY